MRGTGTTGLLWVEEGELRHGQVAKVAPAVRVHRDYTFAVPQELASRVAIGHRVWVRLGARGRRVQGFVVELGQQEWSSTLRPFEALVDDESWLTPELIELGRRIARHYACPLGIALKAMTPEAARKGRGARARGTRMARLIDDPAASGKPVVRLSAQRKAVLDRLAEGGGLLAVRSLMENTGASASVVRGLARVGLIEITSAEPDDCFVSGAALEEPGPVLTDEQTAALAHIETHLGTGKFHATLLFGVSGSGKTEVYIRAIQRVLDHGGQAILLVPEIVLTTQLVHRLAARLPNVAVLHSGLTDTQRAEVWRRTRQGDVQVLVGTRSAVFAPFPRLGLICVDEEQEASFKNLQSPRYHVRDAALMRGHLQGIPVVLGSATPSLETWHNSLHREGYDCVKILRRVRELPLPRVHLVDMFGEQDIAQHEIVFARLTERLLRETLERNRQAVILLNRRGYAGRIMCAACRTRMACGFCNLNLVVHGDMKEAICHYCRRRTPIPKRCPVMGCGGRLLLRGMGTQRVEETLGRLFPAARVLRCDSDTMRHRDEYVRVLKAFAARQADILLGTQMIAKGLDFPGVAFVGVLDADAVVMAVDFRAQERVFQIVTQVAGRAGRADEEGAVVVQTFSPNMAALRYAVLHDYPGFAEQELAARQRVHMPPFRRLTRLLLTHAREERVRKEAEELAQRIREVITGHRWSETEVLGPAPAPLSRLRGLYRYDVLLRTPDASTMHALLEALGAPTGPRAGAAGVTVDVDPVSLG